MTNNPQLDAFLAEPRNLVLAGIRRDGRPHLSPNWFTWDGQNFYVSTTRKRVKYSLFSRDPRVEFDVDDSTGYRTVLVSGIVEIREDIYAELHHFRAIRQKYGVSVPLDDEDFAASLLAEDRVMLVITPSGPPSTWTMWGLEGPPKSWTTGAGH